MAKERTGIKEKKHNPDPIDRMLQGIAPMLTGRKLCFFTSRDIMIVGNFVRFNMGFSTAKIQLDEVLFIKQNGTVEHHTSLFQVVIFTFDSRVDKDVDDSKFPDYHMGLHIDIFLDKENQTMMKFNCGRYYHLSKEQQEHKIPSSVGAYKSNLVPFESMGYPEMDVEMVRIFQLINQNKSASPDVE